jgi:hypothetical protein
VEPFESFDLNACLQPPEVEDAGELEGGGGGEDCGKGHGGWMAGDENVHRKLVDEWGDSMGIKSRLGKSKSIRKLEAVANIESLGG